MTTGTTIPGQQCLVRLNQFRVAADGTALATNYHYIDITRYATIKLPTSSCTAILEIPPRAPHPLGSHFVLRQPRCTPEARDNETLAGKRALEAKGRTPSIRHAGK